MEIMRRAKVSLHWQMSNSKQGCVEEELCFHKLLLILCSAPNVLTRMRCGGIWCMIVWLYGCLAHPSQRKNVCMTQPANPRCTILEHNPRGKSFVQPGKEEGGGGEIS